MFGAPLDYLLLRPLTHKRSIATEEALDSAAAPNSSSLVEDARTTVEKCISLSESLFNIDPAASYLDIGAGTGEKCVALAQMGATDVTGVESMPRSVARARRIADLTNTQDCVQFVCEDIHEWSPAQQYDVLMSFEALEHIDDPEALLRKMRAFLRPGGLALLQFGPLFRSPFGDHMDAFFRFSMPWRSLIFSRDAILRLRRECFRPTDPATRYQDIVGGLNMMRYSHFLQYVHRTGWRITVLKLNSFLQHRPILRRISECLTGMPGLRDFFVGTVFAILHPRAGTEVGEQP